MLVTGASGLVGSHVVAAARAQGIPVLALVRGTSDTSLLDEWGVETIAGDMAEGESLQEVVSGVSLIVHTAAKVGDWGPVEEYRDVNVRGLENLLEAALATGSLKRFVHISSLGVYEARDHYGTDESEKPNATGIDGYTFSKFEAEQLIERYIQEKNLPAVVLRPGFIYGPRDRTVLPKLLERIRNKGFKFLGSGEQLMNNTYVGNLVDAIFLALESKQAVGQIYNITDPALVSKREFVSTIARLAGYDVPTKSVPMPVARGLAKVLEKLWRLRGKQEAPLLSGARIKFLGLNLDFCIDKAKRELNYRPAVEFADGMQQTIESFKENGLV